MRQAIAYIRVSTDRQGESGFGYDAQRAHITAFAKERGFRITKFYSDVDTGMGGDSFDVRPDRALAEERARRTKFPIIVASLDRFARDTATIESRVLQGQLVVISARLGEHATSAEIRAQAYRDQREGELISKRTKDALKFLKDSGVTLGNKQICDVVQPKAVETNKKNAALRLGDFERELAEVQSIGATTAKQIAAAFNERGFLTARGERWTPGNVARAIGKLRARQRSDAIEAGMARERINQKKAAAKLAIQEFTRARRVLCEKPELRSLFMNTTHGLSKTFAPDNQYRIVCPLFGVEVKIADCNSLHNQWMRGQGPTVRKGCQAAMSCSKCPMIHVIREVDFKSESDPYHSTEPKVGRLSDFVMKAIAPIIVPQSTLNHKAYAEMLPRHRELLTEVSGLEGFKKLKGKGDLTLEDLSTSKRTSTRAKPPAVIEAPSATQTSAVTGDLTAALNAAINQKEAA